MTSLRAPLVSASIRTNLCANPQVKTATNWPTTRGFGTGGAGTYGLGTGTTPVGTTFRRKTWTTGNTSVAGGTGIQAERGTSQTTANRWQVTPGERVTISGWVRSSFAQTMRAVVQWVGSANSVGPGPNVLLVPDVWTLISAKPIAPATATAFFVALDVPTAGTWPNWPTGATLDATGLLVEKSNILCPYFDGATSGCSWTGTPDLSTSTKPAEVPYSQWDGSVAQPLTVAGLWDGSAVQSLELVEVEVP